MTPSNIAWTICMFLWFVCFFIGRYAEKRNEDSIWSFFVVMQFVFLGFSWIFIGFNHNWW